MNIILFEPGEEAKPLPIDDNRSRHILGILKLDKGDTFQAGMTGGLLGTATITGIDGAGIHFLTIFDRKPPEAYPLTVIIGLVRPPTAQRLLKDLTSMGVESLHFIVSRLTEKSYGSSHLWTKDEYRYWLREGAQQTRTSILPHIVNGESIGRTLHHLPEGGTRVLLDPAGSRFPLSTESFRGRPAILAVGPERGFTDGEADLFREAGFIGHSLFNRTLRTETACISGAALMLSALGVN